MRTRGPDILLIEDDEGDIDLILEVMKDIRKGLSITVVRDGSEAMDLLRSLDDTMLPVLPRLIMVDLNVPRVDGRELIRLLKSDERLRIIPIIVFTTSDDPRDVQLTYDLGANCYITKPSGVEIFSSTMDCLIRFWFDIATVPRG